MSLSLEDAKKIFSDVNPNHQFWLKDIGPVKNLKELVSSLKYMDDSIFSHHVNKEKNDFSNWIKDIIGDAELAKNIYRITNRKKMVNAIEKRIEKLEKIKRIETEKKDREEIVIVRKIEGAPEELPDANINARIEEILQKEREIEKKGEIISQAEERIEKMIHEGSLIKKKFFSREFTQGLIIGILFSTILILVYNLFLRGLIW